MLMQINSVSRKKKAISVNNMLIFNSKCYEVGRGDH